MFIIANDSEAHCQIQSDILTDYQTLVATLVDLNVVSSFAAFSPDNNCKSVRSSICVCAVTSISCINAKSTGGLQEQRLYIYSQGVTAVVHGITVHSTGFNLLGTEYLRLAQGGWEDNQSWTS